MNYWIVYFLIAALGSGALVGGLVWLRRSPAVRPGLENLLLVGLALFLPLLGLELYFKLFFAQTDDLDTLARQNWRERYYLDSFNSLGYRDQEWTAGMVAGKTKVMVVGDSFVEGAGIEQPAERFPDQLARMLGPEYVVFNLGRRGAYTSQEMYQVLHYPYQPDILIWSYVLNDIEEVAAKTGFARPSGPEVPSALAPLVEHSYAANFLYWRLWHVLAARRPDATWQWLLGVYNDPEAWQLHQEELLAIHQTAAARGVPLLVVVFPGLTNLEQSRAVSGRIVELFRSRGVPTIDVADLVEDRPVADLIASPVDAHPSPLVHRLVAQALYQRLGELGLAGE